MRSFDELNNLEEYFSKMRISDRQKEKRIEAAEEFIDIFLYFLERLEVEIAFGDSPQNVVDFFIEEYSEAVRKYNDNEDFILAYVALLAADITETTLKHFGEEYFTSLERATVLAANEANTVLNQKDYDDAIALGYTRKRWLTELDERVRPTHEELEGVTIPINDLFVVGNAVMRFPHDYEMAGGFAEELSNCRCGMEYIR